MLNVVAEEIKRCRILMVDDQSDNIELLTRILTRAGYSNLCPTTDSRRVLPLFAESQPDIILMDLHMPHLDGLALLEQLGPQIPEGTFLPIVVLTADITREAKLKVLSMGAKDFLNKPLDRTEVLLRIQNLLHTRCLHLQLQDQNKILEEKVRQRTRSLEEARIEVVRRLARASEFRDDDTGQHTYRVSELAAATAAAFGLPPAEVELIRMGAALHDVGKIGIPDEILLKRGRLTDQEYAQMKTHTLIGSEILASSQHALLQLAEAIALNHHERWDGAGYPRGLKGEEIPLAGRIVCVADVFDALTNERPYKLAWTVADALAELERLKGKMFDPQVVGVFRTVVEERAAEKAPRRHILE